MILPTKHIPQSGALIGVGATVLAQLTVPRTVSSLWDRLKREPNVGTFERFVLATDLLFIVGAIEIQ